MDESIAKNNVNMSMHLSSDFEVKCHTNYGCNLFNRPWSSYFATFYAGDRIESIPIKFLFFAILACTSIITPEIDLGEKFLKRSTKMDNDC
jgi:hypothetical protein